MSRRQQWSLLLAAVLGIAVAAACTLNPQPLPPEDLTTQTPGGGSSSGGDPPEKGAEATDSMDGGADADGSDQ
jgi:hypothetical protein